MLIPPRSHSRLWAGIALTLLISGGLLFQAAAGAQAAGITTRPAFQRATPAVPIVAPESTAAPDWLPPEDSVRMGIPGGVFTCAAWQITIPAGVPPEGARLHCGAFDPALAPPAPAGYQLRRQTINATLYDPAGQWITHYLLPLSVCVPVSEADLAADLTIAAAVPGGAWTPLATSVNGSARQACAAVETLGLFELAVRAASPAGGAAQTYRVQPQDTLFRLGLRFGVTVADLMTANRLTSPLIIPGQTLVLPAGAPAAVTPAPSAAVSGAYRVQPGDTLFRLGLRFGTTTAALQAANGLSGHTLYAGQTLIIPAPAAAVPPPATPTAAAPPPAGGYIIQPGDTLFTLARRFNTTVGALQAANGLTTTWIYPGQRLTVPGR